MSTHQPLTVEVSVTPAVAGLWIRTGRGAEGVGLAVRDGVAQLEYYPERGFGPPIVFSLDEVRRLAARHEGGCDAGR